MALTAAFAGAMEGLTRTEHPVSGLSWTAARDNFYAAVRDGIDADMRWILADGTETGDIELLLTDLLEHAAEGLRAVGLPPEAVDSYLQPLSWRVETELTPAAWKRQAVRAELDDGALFAEAIERMQRRYIDRQSETIIGGDFTAWPDP